MWGLGPSGETRTAGLLRAWQSWELSHPAYQSPQRADIPRTTRPVGLLASPPGRCPDQGRWDRRTGPSKAEAPTGPSCSQEPRPLTPSPKPQISRSCRGEFLGWLLTSVSLKQQRRRGPVVLSPAHHLLPTRGPCVAGTGLKALEAKARSPEGRVRPGSHLPVTAAWVAWSGWTCGGPCCPWLLAHRKGFPRRRERLWLPPTHWARR